MLYFLLGVVVLKMTKAQIFFRIQGVESLEF